MNVWDRAAVTALMGGLVGTRYWDRPGRQKEEFAHRFAGEVIDGLRAEGWTPFDRLHDLATLRQQGLDPEWFGVGGHPA